ncbi:MAG: L-lactate dehydrogenase [Coprobacillus sp.]|nr:L-lactate dehydrogenase [Coprobacillus sp.]
MKNRSVVIIGDGMVGSTIAYTLLQEDYVTDISIIDVNTSKVEGDVLDLVHGMSFVGPKIVKVGKYSDIQNAHVAVITAGVAQKEGETRIDLLKRNLKVFDSIIDSMKPYVHDDLVVLVVTNPVDILTYYTYKKLGIPASRVIGSGTVLDTSRLKTVIAEETKVDPRNVHTYILGEHGDSEIPAWSVTNIGGLPLGEYCTECGWKKGEKGLNNLFEKVKNAAYEIISKKGATYYAVGLSVNKILKTILNNTNSVLTVSTYIEDDKFGCSDFYFSLPCIVNSSGIKEVLKLDYSEDEIEGLSKSAATLKDLINQIEE